jgi:glycosyltransferase involved in cell wall biosynthesis
MNLLFVTDVFPFPPHTGSAVISYNWARYLARRHKITVLSALPPEDEDARQRLEEIGAKVAANTKSFVRPRGVRHAASLVPIAMHRLRVREFLAAVEQTAEAHSADVVVVISAGLGALLPRRRRSPPVVFVPYDAESVNFRMRARNGPDPMRRAYFRIETLKWQFVEAHYYPLADACVAVTEEDAEAMSRCWAASDRARIHVIPNGVETTHFAPLPLAEVPDRLLISGNMGSTDTAVSVRWFLQAVLPHIRRRIPKATVEIVGRDPLPSLHVLAQKVRDVKIWGYVPDLRPHLAQASVYVAPLRLGSGTKNRVLEAMAMGKPVVTTPLGIRGLRVQPGRDVLSAMMENAFADAVVELLQNRERRHQIGRAAREAIVTHHSWAAVGNRVENLLNSFRLLAGERAGIEHQGRLA